MVAVISSSAYQTGVQFLSVYIKSVLTLVWPYIRSALFPHFYHSDWSQMMYKYKMAVLTPWASLTSVQFRAAVICQARRPRCS